MRNGLKENIDPKDRNVADDPFDPYGGLVFQILQSLYLFGIFALFVTALGNRPSGTTWLYKTLAVLFAFIMAMMLFMSGWTVYRAGQVI